MFRSTHNSDSGDEKTLEASTTQEGNGDRNRGLAEKSTDESAFVSPRVRRTGVSIFEDEFVLIDEFLSFGLFGLEFSLEGGDPKAETRPFDPG
ncbi:hypothetical protein [Halostagnicola sp. A56]|uniref:hypothetical protein n=1 Tax=Halostagnicola sp. A56 TaxID=1495067 RepID=UPI0012E1251B|nr:hypothetical protein [Halostagnicola sp. A56]